MSITLNCNVSLSKKLRALMGDMGHITLVVNQVVAGKGQGKLVVGIENESGQYSPDTLDALLGSETSIMLTPIELAPNVDLTRSSGNLFTDGDANPLTEHMATTSPPEQKTMAAQYNAVDVPELAPMKKQSAQITQPLIQTAKKELPQNCILNYNGLVAELKKAAQSSDIAPPNLTGLDDRERAVALEKYQQFLGIDIPCYIVNDSCMSLIVNDLEIDLGYNMPVNLSNIPAQKLLLSKDLREILGNKFAKFIPPEDIPKYQVLVQKQEELTYGSSEIFDSSDAAMAAVEAEGFQADGTRVAQTATHISIDNMNELEADTEEEAMMRGLSNQMTQPLPDGINLAGEAGGARTTQHRNASVPEENLFQNVTSPVKKLDQTGSGVVKRAT